MFHPTRGGTRGGQDQFKWEDVKEDKHRENYLGNSLLAPVGRWQKGRDLTWYAKANDSDSDIASIQAKKKAEIQSIKDAEAEAMAEALGYKTKRKTETAVTEKELKTAISKTDSSAQDELGEKLEESSTIQGLGFKSRRQGMFTVTGSMPVSSKLAPVPLIPESAQIGSSRENVMDDNPRAVSKDTSKDGNNVGERVGVQVRQGSTGMITGVATVARGREAEMSENPQAGEVIKTGVGARAKAGAEAEVKARIGAGVGNDVVVEMTTNDHTTPLGAIVPRMKYKAGMRKAKREGSPIVAAALVIVVKNGTAVEVPAHDVLCRQ
ncbi:hypothetical protein BG011_007620 [Mortierella polycephala]|uniref:Multiple myeloma tumor-associated protein 2-like N-terminal domain-containing protein n=1 Tax=Mortierella polycephala TaxID=41804 RepID=A0A9P6TYG7_9FUNG|nr:hypothetical protein BG011_007620 [Mortierella polycephala]